MFTNHDNLIRFLFNFLTYESIEKNINYCKLNMMYNV